MIMNLLQEIMVKIKKKKKKVGSNPGFHLHFVVEHGRDCFACVMSCNPFCDEQMMQTLCIFCSITCGFKYPGGLIRTPRFGKDTFWQMV